MSLEQRLEEIRKYEGKNLSVTYIMHGKNRIETGKLKVDKTLSKCLDLSQGDGEEIHIPTSGNCIIKKITDEEGNTLYEPLD